MIIKPRVKDFICLTSHPEGCKENVRRQIEYVKSQPKVDVAKRVLVIGASTGYGLASRICAAFGSGASTIGIIFDKPAHGKRTATAGWYNTAAFEEFAKADGLYAKTINGDAFSQEIKAKTIELIKEDLGQIDMVVYSLAAPRRTTADGTMYSSVLKTVDEPFTAKTLNLKTNEVTEATLPPATPEEVEATVKVMGGEDWANWMHALKDAGVLAPNALSIAYSYIGSKITYPIYYEGTIGAAKQHLYKTAENLRQEGFNAVISVNKALVTQSSSAIPIVPLYVAVMYRVMKDKNVHEGTIEQMSRLWHDYLSQTNPVKDDEGRIRIDNYEMSDDVQETIFKYWDVVNNDNLKQYADVDGYWNDFYNLFGFGFDNVDYDADVNPEVEIDLVK